MKTQIFKPIFLLILITTNSYSQYKSIKNLTEADALDYLKLEGFQYDINRSEDASTGIISWSGYNGSTSNQMLMLYSFYPFNRGIYKKRIKRTLTESPDINSWIRKLPYNLKVTERSDDAIYASDNTEFDKITLMKALERDEKPYHTDSRGKSYYIWYESEVNFFKPKIQINEIGFNYGYNNEEFWSFLREDTYDLRGMVELFILDYSSYLSNKIHQSMLKRDINGAEILQNSEIDRRQPISAEFKVLENETIAVAVGMNNNNEIHLVVNPESWKNYSEAKRFYIIYHELGHDVFNLNHGNGGKMMYNYAEKEVTWKDFIDDRVKMFDSYIFNIKEIPYEIQDNSKIEGENSNSEYKGLLDEFVELCLEVMKSARASEALKVVELERRIMAQCKKIGFDMDFLIKTILPENAEANLHFALGAALWLEGDRNKGCDYLNKYILIGDNEELVTSSKKLVAECAQTKKE